MKLNITAERIHKLDDRCKEITKNAAQNTKNNFHMLSKGIYKFLKTSQ